MIRSLLSATLLACVVAIGGTVAVAQPVAKPSPAPVPTFKAPGHKPGNPGPLPPGKGNPVPPTKPGRPGHGHPGHGHGHHHPKWGHGHHHHWHHAHHGWRWRQWGHGHHVPIVRFGWPAARWYAGYGWYSFPPAAFGRGYCYVYRYSVTYGTYRWVAVPVPAWYRPVVPAPVLPVEPPVDPGILPNEVPPMHPAND